LRRHNAQQWKQERPLAGRQQVMRLCGAGGERWMVMQCTLCVTILGCLVGCRACSTCYGYYSSVLWHQLTDSSDARCCC
jgi:hypothetical protein